MTDTAQHSLHWSWAAVLTDPVRLSILEALCELRAATTLELSQRCHSSDPTIRRHLEALEALGLVREQAGERDGMTPGRPASRYILASDAAGKMSALFDLLSRPLVTRSEPEMPPLEGRGMVPGSCTQLPARA
jgi:DNA-binding transcriptional ArsR family regulator